MKPVKTIINPKKLLTSKWTAVTPNNKEKHFMVTNIILSNTLTQPIEHIALEAVYSKRKQVLLWQQLNDTNTWLQGWL